MLVRKQILVPAALDKKIRRLAQKRGISQSALIVAAVEALLDTSGQIDHLTPFIGVIKGAPPRLSESSTTFTADAWVGRARLANQVGATVVIPIAEAASAIRLS